VREKRKLVVGSKLSKAKPLTMHVTVNTYSLVVRVLAADAECAATYGDGQGGAVDAAGAAARQLADVLREQSPGPWGQVLVASVACTMGGLRAEDVGLIAVAARDGLLAGVVDE
jgi:hypothetical protein